MRLAALLLLVLALTAPAQRASANPPVFETFAFSDTFNDTGLCGFPITFTFEGTFTIRYFFDRDGELVRIEAHAPDVATAVGSNGTTVTGHEVVNFHVDFANNSERKTGIPVHFNGLLVDAGLLWFDDDVVYIRGNHQLLEGDVERFCDALS